MGTLAIAGFLLWLTLVVTLREKRTINDPIRPGYANRWRCFWSPSEKADYAAFQARSIYVREPPSYAWIWWVVVFVIGTFIVFGFTKGLIFSVAMLGVGVVLALVLMTIL